MRALPSDESTSTTKVKTEPSVPTFEFRGIQLPKAPPAAPTSAKDTDGASDRKCRRARNAIDRLACRLSDVDIALTEVESALDSLPKSRVDQGLAGVIQHLRNAFCDVQIDAETIEDFAEKLSHFGAGGLGSEIVRAS